MNQPQQPSPDSVESVAPAVDETAPAADAVDGASGATADAPEAQAPVETPVESPVETAEETTAEPSDETPVEPTVAESETPRPTPAAPSPAALAGHRPTPPAQAADGSPAAVPAPSGLHLATGPSNAASFGRVDDDGTVYVRTPDGEKPVGSYPGATSEEALGYFARKYDEMWAAAELLYQRVLQTSLSAKEGTEDLAKLRAHIGEANVVGDLAELDAKVESIATAIEARRQVEAQERAVAKEAARGEREALVAEAEQIAAQDPKKVQWKASGARIRELLDEWKKHQRASARLDRDVENALWQRFSAARNSFDKARRVYFAELEQTQGSAKATKTQLVADAERLQTSTDWNATASAYKRLMDQWRAAGRAGRPDDDRLWARFKAAQDAFFTAKDQVSAAEDEAFAANLVVKEELLQQAQALLPVKDLDKTKAALRDIQAKWDDAGKVPRADLARIEGALRKVEQTVRDAEDARWKKSNPEVNHRASAFAEQIERALEKENKALEKAKASGDDAKIKAAEESLASRRALLEMVHKAQQ